MKDSQNNFYRNKFKEAKGNSKDVYKVVNHLLNKGQEKILPESNDDYLLANKFANFFSNKVSDIVNGIGEKPQQEFINCYENMEIQSNASAHSLSIFPPVSKQYILELITKTNHKFSSVDNIPSLLLQSIQNASLDTIHDIVNTSLNTGDFPEMLKNSHVTPVVKDSKQGINSYQNYRPISNLSFMSKLIEKSVLGNLQSHLNEENLNYIHQSAFKSQHSCETALVKIYDDLLHDLGRNRYAIMLFLDFSSAFDTVRHSILLEKLEKQFHITGTALKWFKSFLENRTYQVKIRNCFSQQMSMKYGVPQGSVLGPVLFSLYSQPIHNICTRHGLRIHMFADDVQIYTVSENPEQELSKIKKCLTDITAWAKVNFLKLNENKSKFLVISHNSASLDRFLKLDMNTKFESMVKNLGFTIDRNLSLNAQINRVCFKSFNLLRNLWKISSKLNSVELKTRLVKTCLIPHLDYCNSMYSSLPQKQIRKLQRVMNAAVRFVFNLRRYERVSISAYMKRIHFLPVNCRIDFKVCMFVFKCLVGLAPDYMISLVTPKSSLESLRVHSDKNLLQMPHLENENYRNRRFSVYAPKVWNSLPIEIRNSNSLSEFQTKLKTYLFSRAYP